MSHINYVTDEEELAQGLSNYEKETTIKSENLVHL